MQVGSLLPLQILFPIRTVTQQAYGNKPYTSASGSNFFVHPNSCTVAKLKHKKERSYTTESENDNKRGLVAS